MDLVGCLAYCSLPFLPTPRASQQWHPAELKQRDESGWYRTIYLGVLEGKLHILHCFVKKSGKTPKNDLAIAQTRLKAVRARLLEAKNDAKRKDRG